VLGDGAIEKYGREDLYDVFRAIMPFGLFKACESSDGTSLTTLRRSFGVPMSQSLIKEFFTLENGIQHHHI